MSETRTRVLIWGGTRGLGRELALLSRAYGHHTTITGRGYPTDLAADIRFVQANFDDVLHTATGFYQASNEADVLFWVAGHWLRQSFHETSNSDVNRLLRVHLTTPIQHLRHLIAQRLSDQSDRPPRPLHLVVIASSSAWKVRNDGQAFYGMVQAAKVQFARNVQAEYPELIHKVTIVMPGGMQTGFFQGTEVDTSGFMNPHEAAQAIWDLVSADRPTPRMELKLWQHEDHIALYQHDGNDHGTLTTFGYDDPARADR